MDSLLDSTTPVWEAIEVCGAYTTPNDLYSHFPFPIWTFLIHIFDYIVLFYGSKTAQKDQL